MPSLTSTLRSPFDTHLEILRCLLVSCIATVPALWCVFTAQHLCVQPICTGGTRLDLADVNHFGIKSYFSCFFLRTKRCMPFSSGKTFSGVALQTPKAKHHQPGDLPCGPRASCSPCHQSSLLQMRGYGYVVDICFGNSCKLLHPRGGAFVAPVALFRGAKMPTPRSFER